MIRNRLRVILAERRMTMADLADRAGLHYTTVNRFEKDDTVNIAKPTLNAICQALGVQPGDIFVYVPDEE